MSAPRTNVGTNPAVCGQSTSRIDFSRLFPFFFAKVNFFARLTRQSGEERVTEGWERTRWRRLKGRTLGNRERARWERERERSSGGRWKGWKRSGGSLRERIREYWEKERRRKRRVERRRRDEDRWGRGDSSMPGVNEPPFHLYPSRRYRLSLSQSRETPAVTDIEMPREHILARIFLTKAFARFSFRIVLVFMIENPVSRFY